MPIKIVLLFILCCLGCKNTNREQQEQFDKVKWATRDGMDYPYRDKMLTDIMMNYELHGLTQDQLVQLLGSPDRKDNGYLFYTISQERLGFLPLHTKTLVFKLAPDSTVVWRKIHE